MTSAFERITSENKRRHRHNPDQAKCSYCQSFVSLKGEGKRRQYVCGRCKRAGMKWVNPKGKRYE